MSQWKRIFLGVMVVTFTMMGSLTKSFLNAIAFKPMIRPLLPLLFLGVSAMGQIDSDGDGLSDLWSAQYPEAVLTGGVDSDGDGLSDLEESLALTDPTNPESYFRAGIEPAEDNVDVTLSVQGLPGQLYELQYWNLEDEAWTGSEHSVIQGDGSLIELNVSGDASVRFYRFAVSSVDSDQDGLLAWEEELLGFSDSSVTSSTVSGVPDYAVALQVLEGSGSVLLANGNFLQKSLPSREEAFRFLQQATFGPTEEEISEVMEIGMSGWLNHQLNHETMTLTRNHWSRASSSGVNSFLWTMGWLRAAMVAPDHFRQKFGYALSQIFVNSNLGNDEMRNNPFLAADYYDIFLEHSFASYGDVLEEVTFSVQMGQYLSHLFNQKADPEIGRFPDENFAREIMQLFSIGLVELEPNGAVKLDGDGQVIPTYDQTTVTEMAKIFTGFGHGGPRALFFEAGVSGNDKRFPMKLYDDFHEPGEKHIVGGVTIPAGQTAMEDVMQTLEVLENHSNTAPFMARLLIQRLVTSNPSPEYIRRVSSAWVGEGDQAPGDFKRVARAILLDPEARETGKARTRLQEPFLRFLHLFRTLEASNGQMVRGTHPVSFATALADFGQLPMWAPSVFNFYSPDFSPQGELRDAGLFAPEFEIATTDRLIRTDNFLRSSIFRWITPFGSKVEERLFYDLDQFLPVASDPQALVEAIENKIAPGAFSEQTKTIVVSLLEQRVDPDWRIKTGVHLLIESPDFVVTE